MNNNLYVVLMAGGVGVRFWPYSRNAQPKQFLDVLGVGKTLLQSTYERFLPLCPKENIFVVTHEEHVHLVKQQLSGIGDSQILAEPMRKNTAPCIAYASYKIAKLNKDAIVVVSPSDHLILKEQEFQSVIAKAADQAKKQDKLITLGINPTRPETGYGYIQFIEEKKFLKKVKTFTEKPELSLAKKFLESGDFVWNAIYEISTKDSSNNAVQANALLYDTRNSIIRTSSPDTLVVAQGLNGYLVGVFDNVVIVCEKDKEEQFRKFVNDLKARPGSNEFL